MINNEHDNAKTFLDRLSDFLWEDGPTANDNDAQLVTAGLDPDGLLSRVEQLARDIERQETRREMELAKEAILKQTAIPQRNRREIIEDLQQRPLAARNLESTLDDMTDEQIQEHHQESTWSDALEQHQSAACFWKFFGDRTTTEARVFRLRGSRPAPIRDARGQMVAGIPTLNRAWIFFIDQAPDANWSHPCAYAAIDSTSPTTTTAAWCAWKWPPADEEPLEEIPRPASGTSNGR